MRACSRFIAALLVFTLVHLQAQDPSPTSNPDAWSVKTYRVSLDDLESAASSSTPDPFAAPPEKWEPLFLPAFPSPKATAEEQQAFLKQSNKAARRILESSGVKLPPGSLACYDPASVTLSVRTTGATHELLQVLASAYHDRQPSNIVWMLDILEAPAAEVRAAMKQAQGTADHSREYQALAAKGTSVVALRGTTKSGQRSSGEQITENERVVQYTVDADQKLQAQTEPAPYGTRLELEPVISPDGAWLDVALALDHFYAPPMRHADPVVMGLGQKMEAVWQDQAEIKVQTSLTVVPLKPQLLGVWEMPAHPDATRAASHMQAAFFKTSVVKTLRQMEPRVEELLTRLGEKVEPMPKPAPPSAPASEGKVPPGMILRSFRVSREFFNDMAVSPGQSVDPFASPPAPSTSPAIAPPRPRPAAKDVLVANGVTFPDGAWVIFLPEASTLIICNKPENIEILAHVLDDLKVRTPKLIRLSFSTVQAEAAQVRAWSDECLASADHRAVWQKVEKAVAENKATVTRSALLTTKSGQRTEFTSTVEHYQSAGVKLGGHTQTETTTSETEEPPPPTAPAPADGAEKKPDPKRMVKTTSTTTNSSTLNNRSWSVSAAPVIYGFRADIDPVIGPDGWTLDLSFSVEDSGAPVSTTAAEEAAASPRRLEVPGEEHRSHKATTSLTLITGSTHLLSTWQPTVVPDAKTAPMMQAVFLHAEIVPVEEVE